MYLYLDGTVKDVDTIRYSSAEEMRERGVTVYPDTKVVELKPTEHQIVVENAKTQERQTMSYDRLILGNGVAPNEPDWDGIELENVCRFGGRHSAEELRKKQAQPELRNVAIIGGGYIALEAAMCFAKEGKQVTMLERGEQLIGAQLDPDFAKIIQEELKRNGIVLRFGVELGGLVGKDGKVTGVKLKDEIFPTDLVLVCIGSHPDTEWLDGVLERDKRGFLVVDEYQRTSAKDVFAAGASTAMKFNPTGDWVNIDLATNARKQGRVAAKNLEETVFAYPGMQGTSGLRVYDYYLAATGVTAKVAKKAEHEIDCVTVEELALDSYLPEQMNAKVHAKLYYEKKSHRVVGGQILSKKDMTGMIQALSVAIYAKLTVEELAFMDFFFQPEFNRPWSILSKLALSVK